MALRELYLDTGEQMANSKCDGQRSWNSTKRIGRLEWIEKDLARAAAQSAAGLLHDEHYEINAVLVIHTGS